MAKLNRSSVILATSIVLLIGAMFFFVTCSDQAPSESEATANATLPAGNATIAAGNATIMGGNATLPAGNGTLPAGNGTVPAGNGTVPAGNATLPASNATLPAGNATLPAGNATSPFGNATLAPETLDLAETESGAAETSPDQTAADQAAADKAAADKAAADKAAADKAAADKAAADKAAADKAAADKAAADKAAADQAAAQESAGTRFGQDAAKGKVDMKTVEEVEAAEAIAASTTMFRGKDGDTPKPPVADADSGKADENLSVTPPKSGAETGTSTITTTQMAAATDAATSQALAAGQDPTILAGLEALARKRVSTINAHIQPNRNAAHVTQQGGVFVAQYYYVPEDSIKVSYRDTEPGTPFKYAGQVRYRECLYESRGASKEEALSGQFSQVSTKNMTEIMRYVGNAWKE